MSELRLLEQPGTLTPILLGARAPVRLRTTILAIFYNRTSYHMDGGRMPFPQVKVPFFGHRTNLWEGLCNNRQAMPAASDLVYRP